MNPAELIDHTLLKPPITEEDIERLCNEAKSFNFFSVCIPPCYVPLAKRLLKGTDVLVCTVIGFPLGYSTSHVKFLEARNAVARGADELDIVLNVGYLKDKKNDEIKTELSLFVEKFKEITIKVIIETALLSDGEKLEISLILKDVGIDFIKTSTGFLGAGAKASDIKLIKRSVGSIPKIKASGGIKTLKNFNEMVLAGANRVGTSSGVSIMEEFLKI